MLCHVVYLLSNSSEVTLARVTRSYVTPARVTPARVTLEMDGGTAMQGVLPTT